MSKALTIVATIEAKPDKIDLVKAELQKLIAPTLKEAGCIQYDLHQDNQNPAFFLIFRKLGEPGTLAGSHEQHSSCRICKRYRRLDRLNCHPGNVAGVNG